MGEVALQFIQFAQYLDTAQLPSEFLQKHAKVPDSLFRRCLNLGLWSHVLYSRHRPRKQGRVYVGHGKITFGASRRNFNSNT